MDYVLLISLFSLFVSFILFIIRLVEFQENRSKPKLELLIRGFDGNLNQHDDITSAELEFEVLLSNKSKKDTAIKKVIVGRKIQGEHVFSVISEYFKLPAHETKIFPTTFNLVYMPKKIERLNEEMDFFEVEVEDEEGRKVTNKIYYNITDEGVGYLF